MNIESLLQNPIVKFEISASSVAWYGAIVATVSALATLYKIIQDRTKLLITIKPNMKVYPKNTPYGDTTNVVVSIVNGGRRPITISNVWFETRQRDKPGLLLSDSIRQGSVELSEGKGSDYLCDQNQKELLDARFVCVSDSKGRTHRRKLSRVVAQAIKDYYEELHHNES